MSRKHAPPPGTLGGSPVSKKRHSGRVVNAQLMPDVLEWPPLDTLWQSIGDLASEMYLKYQPSLKEYKPVAKQFLARLSLVVRGLKEDQILVIFRASVPTRYSSAKKADKVRIFEIFEFVRTWVENQLIGKLRALSQVWDESKGGAEYQEQWLFAKFVSSLFILY